MVGYFAGCGVGVKVLIACESSGEVRDAFIRRGHDAMSCDLLPTERPGPHHQGDVRDVLYQRWDLLIAHPTCTYLTNSGVRWLKKAPPGRTLAEMWAELDEGAALFSACWNAPIPLKALENPVMHKHAKARIVSADWGRRALSELARAPLPTGSSDAEIHRLGPEAAARISRVSNALQARLKPDEYRAARALVVSASGGPV